MSRKLGAPHKAFRDLLRLKNDLECFTQFTFDDLPLDEQLFADYRSKYLDLYDKVRSNTAKEKTSILDDIDFELELIRRDKINVSYIIALLQNLQDATPEAREKQHKAILGVLDSETQLRSKRELIERFIADHFPDIPKGGDIGKEFDRFWDEEKQKALQKLSANEELDQDRLQKVIDDYLFTDKTPMRDQVIGTMNARPKLKERATVSERIIAKIKSIIETFVDDVD